MASVFLMFMTLLVSSMASFLPISPIGGVSLGLEVVDGLTGGLTNGWGSGAGGANNGDGGSQFDLCISLGLGQTSEACKKLLSSNNETPKTKLKDAADCTDSSKVSNTAPSHQLPTPSNKTPSNQLPTPTTPESVCNTCEEKKAEATTTTNEAAGSC